MSRTIRYIVKVSNTENSIYIQKKLFKEGFTWCEEIQNIKHENNKYLILENSKDYKKRLFYTENVNKLATNSCLIYKTLPVVNLLLTLNELIWEEK